MPSIKREMDALDKQEREQRQQEAAGAFLKTFLEGYNKLPSKDKGTILDLMHPERNKETGV